MDERELLVLGLLMTQSQHGYQINDFIERNLGQVSDMKKATAYAILKRLDKQGCVNVTVEQEATGRRARFTRSRKKAKTFFSIAPSFPGPCRKYDAGREYRTDVYRSFVAGGCHRTA
ncbi:Transcriptional regulator PadR-like family protein [Paenibacillus sp. P1XP2]|nr:Transcriptional regulator PadR-like family protein [Paenibacillus sp. P1XP2]